MTKISDVLTKMTAYEDKTAVWRPCHGSQRAKVRRICIQKSTNVEDERYLQE